MQFIKKNLFYSSLVAIVVIVGGALVAMVFSSEAATDAKVAPTIAKSREIGKLYSKPYVNERVNRGKKSQVRETERLLRRTVDNSARWSRGDGRDAYTSMVLPKHDESGEKIGTIKAFPIDAELYKKHDLRYWATVQYRKLMADIFKRLHPTSPPTGEEIEAELDKINAILAEIERQRLRREELERLEQEAKDKDVEDDGKKDGKAGAKPTTRPGKRPTGKTGDEPGPKDGKKEPEPEVIDYEKMARNNMRLFKAGMAIKGKTLKGNEEPPPEVSIFADPAKALDLIFAAARTDPSDTELWDAQLHLWIVEDIVDTIARINDMSLARPKGLSVKKSGKTTAGGAKGLPLRRTVPNSAIKHLVAITVSRGYLAGGVGAAPSSPRSSRRPKPTGRPVSTGAFGLTGRTTCRQYEIKRYSFTVIMDTRYLPDLQKALLTNNQHTILNVTKTSVNVSDTDSDNLYYYGAGAVMRVTIEGELLMISEWTRGSWLAEESTWSKAFQPLMPIKVLRDIYDSSPGALRPEDITRMNSKK